MIRASTLTLPLHPPAPPERLALRPMLRWRR